MSRPDGNWRRALSCQRMLAFLLNLVCGLFTVLLMSRRVSLRVCFVESIFALFW